MRRLLIAILTAAALAAPSLVAGQTSTTDPSAPPPASRGPSVASPYWTVGGADPVTGTDLPAADIRAIPPARANSVRTYWNHQEALTDLNNAVRLARMQMDREPAYKKAVAEEKAAYDALEAARAKAVADLQGQPAYSGAEDLRQRMSDQISAEHELKQPDPGKLLAMARLKIQYVKDNRKLEADALSRDTAYQDARRTYAAAAQRLRDYDDAKSFALATDDAIVSLRRAVASARIEKVTASAYYDSLLRARRDAFDYAADLRDFYRGRGVVSTYGGYGGGYGYGGYAGYGLGGYGYGIR